MCGRGSSKTCLMLRNTCWEIFFLHGLQTVLKQFSCLEQKRGRRGQLCFYRLHCGTELRELRDKKEAGWAHRYLSQKLDRKLCWVNSCSAALGDNCWLRPQISTWAPSIQSLGGFQGALTALIPYSWYGKIILFYWVQKARKMYMQTFLSREVKSWCSLSVHSLCPSSGFEHLSVAT